MLLKTHAGLNIAKIHLTEMCVYTPQTITRICSVDLCMPLCVEFWKYLLHLTNNLENIEAEATYLHCYCLFISCSAWSLITGSKKDLAALTGKWVGKKKISHL